MRYGSLFSGIGGFDLGLDRAGMACAWQVEIDPACRSVLRRHWPGVPQFDDVLTVGRENLEPVDVICGGFPCQDLSVAGRRAGLAGERSGLWHEFHRVLGELEPRWCVIENVPGLLSSQGGRDFAVILRGLVELGYRVAWRVLDAQYFGVAQRRRRVFIVGSLGDGRSAEVLFERAGVPGHPQTGREARPELARDVAASLKHGGGNGRGYNLDAEGGLVASRTVAPALTQNYGKQPDNSDTNLGPMLVASPITASAGHHGHGSPRGDGSDNLVAYGVSENQRAEVLLSDVARSITSGGGKPGQGYPAVMTYGFSAGQSTGAGTLAFQPEQAPTVRGASSGTNQVPSVLAFSSKDHGADATADLAPTLRSMNYDQSHINGGGQVAIAFSNRVGAHGEVAETLRADCNGALPMASVAPGVRRLTPRECSRLQGFPDDWTAGQADSVRYRQLGNAVCVPVAAWIGQRMIEVER